LDVRGQFLELLLDLNGFALAADDSACVVAMSSLASGEMTEEDLAAWICDHLSKR
jgi:prophage maintenance system killer protein